MLLSPLRAIGRCDPINHPSPQPPQISQDSSQCKMKKTTNISIGLLNVRSCVNKAKEINALIEEKDLDVLCLTETWLKDGDDPVIVDMLPPGYNCQMLDVEGEV